MKQNKGTYEESQGRRKFTQYIEDLKRNENFRKDFNKLCKISIRENKKFEKEATKVMRKYGITYGTLEGLGYYIDDKEEFNWGSLNPRSLICDDYDMCMIVDTFQLKYGKKYQKINKEYWNEDFDPEIIIKSYLSSYPIGINIHKFASKRDVIDFIEKRWPSINAFLKTYREKPKRIRKRKLSRKLADCIWENHNLPVKKIKQIIDEEFPHNGLVYWQILKIKNLEKKRRNRKIS